MSFAVLRLLLQTALTALSMVLTSIHTFVHQANGSNRRIPPSPRVTGSPRETGSPRATDDDDLGQGVVVGSSTGHRRSSSVKRGSRGSRASDDYHLKV